MLMSAMVLCDLDDPSALRKEMLPSDKSIVCVGLYACCYCHTVSRRVAIYMFPGPFSLLAEIDTTPLRVAGLFRVVPALFKWPNQRALDLLPVQE